MSHLKNKSYPKSDPENGCPMFKKKCFLLRVRRWKKKRLKIIICFSNDFNVRSMEKSGIKFKTIRPKYLPLSLNTPFDSEL